MPIINSGTPRHIDLGTEDKSRRIVYPKAPGNPQHRALLFLKTAKGPVEPVHEEPNVLSNIYGDESFDPVGKYFTHQTLMANILVGAANAISVKRVPPVIEKNVNGEDLLVDTQNAISIFGIQVTPVENREDYLRDINGKPILDVNGSVQRDSNVKLDKVKVSAKITDITSEAAITALNDKLDGSEEAIKAGMGIVDDNGTKFYPLFAVEAYAPGAAYNEFGYNITPDIGLDRDNDLLDKKDALSYSFSWSSRVEGRINLVKATTGDTKVQFSFGSDVIHPITNQKLDLQVRVPGSYSNLTDPQIPFSYPEFKIRVVHQENIEALLTALADVEKNAYEQAVSAGLFPEAWFDVNSPDEYPARKNIINFLSCKSVAEEVPYFGIEINDAPGTTIDKLSAIDDEIKLKNVSVNSVVPYFLSGGSDGIEQTAAGEDVYEKYIRNYLEKYSDPDDEVQEYGLNPEMIIYDTGFSMDTKKKFLHFIKVRRNTMVGLSTYTENEFNRPLKIADEVAYGVVLKNLLKLAPESTEFGTEVMRGFIAAGSMNLVDGSYPKRVSTIFEIGYKLARRAGRGDGKFSSADKFDRIPGSFLKLGKDIEPAFIPSSIKTKMYETGLIWPQVYDRVQYFFPQFQTVYSDSTSVLNNIETVLAICTIHTKNDWAWKNFSGTTSLSEAEFKDAVENYIKRELRNKFDGMYVIVPEVILTDGDKTRGYSWHLQVTIYANNMKTVMVSKVVARRRSDLAENV